MANNALRTIIIAKKDLSVSIKYGLPERISLSIKNLITVII